MKKKAVKKKLTKRSSRSRGQKECGVSMDETVLQVALYLGYRLGEGGRSGFLRQSVFDRIELLKHDTRYAKDLEGLEQAFNEDSGQMMYKLPEHIKNFKSPKNTSR